MQSEGRSPRDTHVQPFRSEARLVEETSRRQDEYEWQLDGRLQEEEHMDPDKKLDELGHEIFRLAIFKGERADKAADMAMRDPLAKRERICRELADSVAHELDWYADDCHPDKRERPIRSVGDLLDDPSFLVMPECYQAFGRITKRGNSRNADRRLRSELSRRGQLLRGRGDYLSVLVPGRYVMHIERSADGMLSAVSLTRPGRRQPSASQRKAA